MKERGSKKKERQKQGASQRALDDYELARLAESADLDIRWPV
jgi:hypothetical protein